ncbi:TetR family transcriptional regulator [Streptomyces sp. B1866]|uniref:TetR/AcrR family transcriptional regulator n=1 Tax=Streptomyces sp. B1866 TaxID=3075431 RepID=UPI00288CDE73|nr:TetR family transcriptional regulator [Streptomyces sp. B1866]MDT3399972.1 TetR family transcriptional regulator [Streptomyces sp. B1866]
MTRVPPPSRPTPAVRSTPAPTAGTAAPAPRRRGRGRPARTSAAAAPAARDRILEAARNEFAAHGYDRTSIRGIAKAADVDPALVHHYFGTKDQVFAAAIELIFAPTMGVPEVVHAGPDGAGERMARFLLGIWEDPVLRAPLLAVLRSAVTNEKAAAVLRRMIERRLLLPTAVALAVPDAELRAQLAAAHLLGIALQRYVLRMEPVASARVDDIVALVGPSLQRYLAGP